jgi:hypothetical protein
MLSLPSKRVKHAVVVMALLLVVVQLLCHRFRHDAPALPTTIYYTSKSNSTLSKSACVIKYVLVCWCD